MAIVRDVLNRVLRTIGETEIAGSVTTLTDSYQLLVLTFLNQIKEEIEDAHHWRCLRQTINVTITGGTNVASISAANERSRLFRILDNQNGRAVPLVFDITDPDEPIPLQEWDVSKLLYMQRIDDDQNAEPVAFALDIAAGGTPRLLVHPTPAASRTIAVTLTVPQDYLEANSMATVVSIPVRPLIMGTIWYALMERGEEQGVSAVFTEERYRRALDDLVSVDAEDQGGYELIAT